MTTSSLPFVKEILAGQPSAVKIQLGAPVPGEPPKWICELYLAPKKEGALPKKKTADAAAGELDRAIERDLPLRVGHVRYPLTALSADEGFLGSELLERSGTANAKDGIKNETDAQAAITNGIAALLKRAGDIGEAAGVVVTRNTTATTNLVEMYKTQNENLIAENQKLHKFLMKGGRKYRKDIQAMFESFLEAQVLAIQNGSGSGDGAPVQKAGGGDMMKMFTSVMGPIAMTAKTVGEAWIKKEGLQLPAPAAPPASPPAGGDSAASQGSPAFQAFAAALGLLTEADIANIFRAINRADPQFMVGKACLDAVPPEKQGAVQGALVAFAMHVDATEGTQPEAEPTPAAAPPAPTNGVRTKVKEGSA